MKMGQPGGYLLLQRSQGEVIVAWIRVVAAETVRGRCILDSVGDSFPSSHTPNIESISNLFAIPLKYVQSNHFLPPPPLSQSKSPSSLICKVLLLHHYIIAVAS